LTRLPPPATYRRSLHGALPISTVRRPVLAPHVLREDPPRLDAAHDVDSHVAMERRPHVLRPHRCRDADGRGFDGAGGRGDAAPRSEEHTSELQSRFDLVCRLLL